jgi:hypothetical protein
MLFCCRQLRAFSFRESEFLNKCDFFYSVFFLSSFNLQQYRKIFLKFQLTTNKYEYQ